MKWNVKPVTAAAAVAVATINNENKKNNVV